jgi:cell division transport system permease protein
MSGSYDKPGPPRRPHPHQLPPTQRHPAPPAPGQYPHQPYPHHQQPQQQAVYQQPYQPDYAEFYAEEHPTAPQTQRNVAPPAPPRESAERELVAPVRDDTDLELRQTPIVPAGSVTGKSLTLVVTIMCFLACLTAGAVYMINQSAAAWLRDIASEVTVQIEPRERLDVDRTVRDVVTFLSRQPGVTSAKPLSIQDSALLLEPWLGSPEALQSLPMPRLIAVEVDRDSPPDFGSLRTALTKQFPAATLDDHRQWQQQIRAVTRSFALGGIAILLLVAAATTAIIVSATRSAMASNREIVEVLHYVGATDRLIAREFERHFLRLGIKAGMVGAVSASLVFLALPLAMQTLGGGTVTQAELSRLVGSGSLDLKGYLVLAGLVIVIAALCMLTSRVGVKRILHSQK